MVAIDLKHFVWVHVGAQAAALLALWLIHRWRSHHDRDHDRDHGSVQLGFLGLAWLVANLVSRLEPAEATQYAWGAIDILVAIAAVRATRRFWRLRHDSRQTAALAVVFWGALGVSCASLLAIALEIPARPWTWQEPGKYVHDVAAAPDGSIATFAGRRLLRFSPDGTRVQDREFGPRSVVTAIAFAPDGDLVAVGYFEDELDLGGKTLSAGDRDGFVACYRPDGTLRWSVRAPSDWSVEFFGVAVSQDRVVVVGRTRGKGKIGEHALVGDTGLQALFDGAGNVVAVEQVDLGNEGELSGACALPDGFVVTGWDRPRSGDRGVVRRISRDGAVRWTVAPNGPASEVTCRADGTSFVAVEAHGTSSTGETSEDLQVLQLDAAGKLVRSIDVVTPQDDRVLSLSATGDELVVSSMHRLSEERGMASRISRFDANGERQGIDEYAGADSIYVRSVHRGDDLVLAGEVLRGASTEIEGIKLEGPAIFVIAPP
jgi:hypothetical protein